MTESESSDATVFVVDDEPFVLETVSAILDSYQIRSKTYASASSFLHSFNPDQRGCMLIDLKLPDMSGIELHNRVRDLGGCMPAIMFSGRGSIPDVSESMRGGAVDFLQKPVDADVLAERVREAIKTDARELSQRELFHALRERVRTFSPRERQVGGYVLDGMTAKLIADRLGIETKTVEVHRSRLVRKAGSGSTLEFVRDLASCGVRDSISFSELLVSLEKADSYSAR